jgi:hypothetical protein
MRSPLFHNKLARYYCLAVALVGLAIIVVHQRNNPLFAAITLSQGWRRTTSAGYRENVGTTYL